MGKPVVLEFLHRFDEQWKEEDEIKISVLAGNCLAAADLENILVNRTRSPDMDQRVRACIFLLRNSLPTTCLPPCDRVPVALMLAKNMAFVRGRVINEPGLTRRSLYDWLAGSPALGADLGITDANFLRDTQLHRQ